MKVAGNWASVGRNAMVAYIFLLFPRPLDSVGNLLLGKLTQHGLTYLCPMTFTSLSTMTTIFFSSSASGGDLLVRVAMAWHITGVQLEACFLGNQALMYVWGKLSIWQSKGK